jgi:ketosteroid isomerase-like protein
MRRTLIAGLAFAALLAACSSQNSAALSAARATQQQADLYAIDQVEVTWHKAASTKDVDLMMTLWADNARFIVGTTVLTGRDQIRNFFVTKAAPFKPENHWVSDTLPYKVKATVNGDQGTIYFECHYIDTTTRKVMVVVGSDVNVARIKGRWLITSAVGSSPALSA